MADNSAFFVVSVVRNGVKRTASMARDEARATVVDAVRHGYEVASRPMTDADPIILGVREEPIAPESAQDVLKEIVDYRERVGPLGFQLEKLDGLIHRARIVLEGRRS